MQSQHLRRRLILYFITLLVLLLVAAFVFLSSFGLLVDTEKQTKSILDSYINEFSASVTEQYDYAAAHGIRLAEELSVVLSRELSESGHTFSELSNNADAILNMENEALPILIDSLEKAPVSGVFFSMDTTVNSSLTEAGQYKSGLYIKIANVNTANPISPELLLFRGSPDVAHQNGMILHNKWELEFRTDTFTFIEKVKAEAGTNLSASYYASPVLTLPGTWEAASYVSVPVFGPDGTFYGVCGFEISRIYFEHYHRMNAETFRVSSLFAQRDEAGIIAGSGLESGLYSGYRAQIADRPLTARQMGDLIVYTDGEDSFIGVEKLLTLSPLEDDAKWFAAVMIPMADYDMGMREQVILMAVFALLILVVAILASVLLAHRYVRPITDGLEQIKQRGADGFKPTNVSEIDDLIEYLMALDEEHKTVGEEKESLAAELEQARQKELDIKNSSAVSAYENFLANLNTLTATERTVFNYYMDNLTAQEIASKMFIALTTVKFHNKNIYAKLGVSSLKALMVYVNMMKGEQNGKQ